MPRHELVVLGGHFGTQDPGRTPRRLKNDLGGLYMAQTRPEFKKRCVGSFIGARSKTKARGVPKVAVASSQAPGQAARKSPFTRAETRHDSFKPNTFTPPPHEFYLGAVVDLKGPPPCVASSR